MHMTKHRLAPSFQAPYAIGHGVAIFHALGGTTANSIPIRSLAPITTKKGAHISYGVCGPISPQSRHGNNYFITFVDARTRYTLLGFLSKHSKGPTHIFQALHYILTFTGRYPQFFRADNAKEYVPRLVQSELEKCGIQFVTTTPYSPQENAIAERIESLRSTNSRKFLVQNDARSTGVLIYRELPHE